MQSSELLAEIKRFFQTHFHTIPQSVCVAVSGGSDSVALFSLLYRFKEQLGISRLAIIHINHRLRGSESDDDEAFVRRLAQQTDTPFFLTTLTPLQKNTGIEEWARAQRYLFFEHIRKTQGYDAVATGHTANDQAETVLMRMARGCGLKGLCAITPVRQDGIIRPLLQCTRQQLREWLVDINAEYREDSSNADTLFQRNRIRHTVIPQLCSYNENAVAHLAGLADHARAAWKILEPILMAWITDNVCYYGESAFSISRAALTQETVCKEALAELFRKKHIRFGHKHIDDFITNSHKRAGIFLLAGGWNYKANGDVVQVTKENPKPVGRISIPEDSFYYELAVPGRTECIDAGVCFCVDCCDVRDMENPAFDNNNMTVFLDARSLCGSLVFRAPTYNDSFTPLGCSGTRNVRSFILKQTHARNTSVPVGVVATSGGEILWIPGIRISDAYKLSPDACTILKISCNLLK
jgi:tRNA(Ile)-lysidine synthase